MAISRKREYDNSKAFTAGEYLTKGAPVYVYDDGGVAKIKKCGSIIDNAEEYERGYYNTMAILDNTHFVLAYRNVTSPAYGRAVVGTINWDNTITFGTPVTFYAGTCYYIDVCAVDASHFVVVYKRNGDNLGCAKVGVVSSGDVISYGSEYTFSTGYSYYNTCCNLATANVFVVCWRDGGVSNYGIARCGEIRNGNQIYWTQDITFYTITCSYLSVCQYGDTDRFVISFSGANGWLYGLSGIKYNGAFDWGTVATVNSERVYTSYVTYSNGRVMFIYRDYGQSSYCNSRSASVVGENFSTWSPEKTLNAANSYYHAVSKGPGGTYAAVVAQDTSPYATWIIKGSPGNPITITSKEKLIDNGRMYYPDIKCTDSGKVIACWYCPTDYIAKALVLEGDINTVMKCIGVLREIAYVHTKKIVDLLGGLSKALTGMTIGELMYVQDDGSITNNPTSAQIGIAVEDDELFITKTTLE